MSAPTALAIIFTLVAMLLAGRAGVARTDRRRLLRLLAEYGPRDGGHLLEMTPMRRDDIASTMARLERAGLVEHVPSEHDPFWRDVWTLTEAGEREASR